MKKNLFKVYGIFIIFVLTIIALAPDIVDAKGSFGGSRGGGRSSGSSSRSFGGSRSSSFKSAPAPAAPRSSFGGSKQSTGSPSAAPKSSFGGSKSSAPSTFNSSPAASSFSNKASSFGGTQLSREQAQMKYGVPRKTETRSYVDNGGMTVNYRVHEYGGFGSGFASGLMTGYMMGHTPWYWHTPFHPAYYYSRPVYAVGADGVPEMYPPVFSFMKLLFNLIIIGAIIFIIAIIIKSRRRRSSGGGSFS